jgi:hypothetical protein
MFVREPDKKSGQSGFDNRVNPGTISIFRKRKKTHQIAGFHVICAPIKQLPHPVVVHIL